MCRWNMEIDQHTCGHEELSYSSFWTACHVVSDIEDLPIADPCDESDTTVHYRRKVYPNDGICPSCSAMVDGTPTRESRSEVESGEGPDDDDELEEGEIGESSEPQGSAVAEPCSEELDEGETIASRTVPTGPKPRMDTRAPESGSGGGWSTSRGGRHCTSRRRRRRPDCRVTKSSSRSGSRKDDGRATSKLIRDDGAWIGSGIKAARRPVRPTGAGSVVDEARLIARARLRRNKRSPSKIGGGDKARMGSGVKAARHSVRWDGAGKVVDEAILMDLPY